MAREQIGTVEITRVRVYPLDPAPHATPETTTVVVQPGSYPVYRDGLSHYWRMTGTLNHRHIRLGDGLFAMHGGDVPSDDDVTFYSQRYGPDEWAELLAGFKGDADPRLVFTIAEPDEHGHYHFTDSYGGDHISDLPPGVRDEHPIESAP